MYKLTLKPVSKAKSPLLKVMSWKRDDRKPPIGEKEEIVQFYADGRELTYIQTIIHGIPYCNGFCVWKAPWAQFIYDNL